MLGQCLDIGKFLLRNGNELVSVGKNTCQNIPHLPWDRFSHRPHWPQSLHFMSAFRVLGSYVPTKLTAFLILLWCIETNFRIILVQEQKFDEEREDFWLFPWHTGPSDSEPVFFTLVRYCFPQIVLVKSFHFLAAVCPLCNEDVSWMAILFPKFCSLIYCRAFWLSG